MFVNHTVTSFYICIYCHDYIIVIITTNFTYLTAANASINETDTSTESPASSLSVAASTTTALSSTTSSEESANTSLPAVQETPKEVRVHY